MGSAGGRAGHRSLREWGGQRCPFKWGGVSGGVERFKPLLLRCQLHVLFFNSQAIETRGRETHVTLQESVPIRLFSGRCPEDSLRLCMRVFTGVNRLDMEICSSALHVDVDAWTCPAHMCVKRDMKIGIGHLAFLRNLTVAEPILPGNCFHLGWFSEHVFLLAISCGCAHACSVHVCMHTVHAKLRATCVPAHLGMHMCRICIQYVAMV
jgi:hypothetical protein